LIIRWEGLSHPLKMPATATDRRLSATAWLQEIWITVLCPAVPWCSPDGGARELSGFSALGKTNFKRDNPPMRQPSLHGAGAHMISWDSLKRNFRLWRNPSHNALGGIARVTPVFDYFFLWVYIRRCSTGRGSTEPERPYLHHYPILSLVGFLQSRIFCYFDALVIRNSSNRGASAAGRSYGSHVILNDFFRADFSGS
jgi:hypothetical protein